MPHASLLSFFEVVKVCGVSLTLYKLISTGLYRRYRFFFLYFLFRIPDTFGTLLLDVKSKAYFRFWAFSLPLAWILYILAVRELYGLVLARHRGIYTLGRWAMYLSIAISMTLSVLSLLPRFTPATAPRSKWIAYLLAGERSVSLSLAIFLVLLLLLLSQYLSFLSRNVVVHAVLFASFFLVSSIGNILATFFGIKLYTAIDTARIGISAVLTFGWFILLSRQAEEPASAPQVLELGHEKRMLAQLDALNETLLKVGQK